LLQRFEGGGSSHSYQHSRLLLNQSAICATFHGTYGPASSRSGFFRVHDIDDKKRNVVRLRWNALVRSGPAKGGIFECLGEMICVQRLMLCNETGQDYFSKRVSGGILCLG
jgi:hypothetical protein